MSQVAWAAAIAMSQVARAALLCQIWRGTAKYHLVSVPGINAGVVPRAAARQQRSGAVCPYCGVRPVWRVARAARGRGMGGGGAGVWWAWCVLTRGGRLGQARGGPAGGDGGGGRLPHPQQDRPVTTHPPTHPHSPTHSHAHTCHPHLSTHRRQARAYVAHGERASRGFRGAAPRRAARVARGGRRPARAQDPGGTQPQLPTPI
jgi:hypothetical protein